jgi:hypothetical protein
LAVCRSKHLVIFPFFPAFCLSFTSVRFKRHFPIQMSPWSNITVRHLQYILPARCELSGHLLGILLIVCKVEGSPDLSLEFRSPCVRRSLVILCTVLL